MYIHIPMNITTYSIDRHRVQMWKIYAVDTYIVLAFNNWKILVFLTAFGQLQTLVL